jgi:hypothetical protein
MTATRLMLTIAWGVAMAVVAFLLTTLVLARLSPSFGPSQRSDEGSGQRGSENLLWPSENFTSPNWVRLHIAAVQPAVAKAPNGSLSASKLVESADNDRHFIYEVLGGMHPGAIHTFSVFVKPDERPTVKLEMRDNPQKRYGNVLCSFPKKDIFNVRSAATATHEGDVVDGGMEDVGDGWYRCWAAMPFDLANFVVEIEMIGPYNSPIYQGDGHSGVLIWGAQFEAGSRPNAYIETTAGPLAKGT